MATYEPSSEYFILTYAADQLAGFNNRSFHIRQCTRHSFFQAHLQGIAIEEAKIAIMTQLNRDNYQFPAFKHGVKKYRLCTEVGVRLSIIFATLQGLKTTNQINKIYRGLEQMSDYESLYWFAFLANDENPEKAIRALRALHS